LEREVILAAAKTAGFKVIINICDFSEKGSDRPTGQDMIGCERKQRKFYARNHCLSVVTVFDGIRYIIFLCAY
jgi:hypothetical protein